MNIPVDIILYAIVAGFLVLWLRNTLGTRHGDERQRPNPFVQSEKNEHHVSDPITVKDSNGKLATMILPDNVHPELAAGISAIQKIDKTFDPQSFQTAAQDAFVFIVEAFAEGDRATLKDLLSEKVYKAFDKVIKKREKDNHRVETEILAVRKADIIEASVKASVANVAVRFTADETSLTYDKDDNIVQGNPERVTETIDVWVFERNLKSKDPTWRLSETRDDVPEDGHKTPIPETA